MSSPSQPAEIHEMDPSLVGYDHMVIEPFPRRRIKIPIFPPNQKLTESDKFDGKHLILYRPGERYPKDFEYQSVIEPIDIERRLKRLMLSYGRQIIDMCITAHTSCDPGCHFCSDHLPHTQRELRKGDGIWARDSKSWNTSLLALDLRMLMMWSTMFILAKQPPSVAASTRDLAEICSLLQEGGLYSIEYTGSWSNDTDEWEQMIKAHTEILLGYPLSIDEIVKEKMFSEPHKSVENSVLLAIRCGKYEDVFIYAKEEDLERAPADEISSSRVNSPEGDSVDVGSVDGGYDASDEGSDGTSSSGEDYHRNQLGRILQDSEPQGQAPETRFHTMQEGEHITDDDSPYDSLDSGEDSGYDSLDSGEYSEHDSLQNDHAKNMRMLAATNILRFLPTSYVWLAVVVDLIAVFWLFIYLGFPSLGVCWVGLTHAFLGLTSNPNRIHWDRFLSIGFLGLGIFGFILYWKVQISIAWV